MLLIHVYSPFKYWQKHGRWKRHFNFRFSSFSWRLVNQVIAAIQFSFILKFHMGSTYCGFAILSVSVSRKRENIQLILSLLIQLYVRMDGSCSIEWKKRCVFENTWNQKQWVVTDNVRKDHRKTFVIPLCCVSVDLNSNSITNDIHIVWVWLLHWAHYFVFHGTVITVLNPPQSTGLPPKDNQIQIGSTTINKSVKRL